jgi:hypothetical protein
MADRVPGRDLMVDEQPAEPAASNAPPRLPSLGASASGLVALLLVSAIRFIPIFGAIIAPLGLLPVIRFQASGELGIRAWGPVVGLLAVAWMTGLTSFAGSLLMAYALVIVLPAVSIEAWVRMRWNEGRWVLWASMGALGCSLLAVAGVALPDSPILASERWWNESLAMVSEIYQSAGMPEGEIERTLMTIEAASSVIPLLLPAAPILYYVAILFWIRPRLELLGMGLRVSAFESYRNDDWLAAVFAASGIGTLLLNGVPRWFAINALAVTLILYFVQGLAMIRAHLARWFGRGWLLRWGVALLCLQGPLPLVVATLGIADSFHPLRPRADDNGGTP